MLNDNSNAILSISKNIENLKQLPQTIVTIERLLIAYLNRSSYYLLSVIDYENSLKDSQEGLNILQKIKNHKEDYDKNAELGLLINAGMAYFQKQELDVALSYFDKAIVLYEKEDKAIFDSDFIIRAFVRRANIYVIYYIQQDSLLYLKETKKNIQEASKIYEISSEKEANTFLELNILKIQVAFIQENMQEVINIYEEIEQQTMRFEQYSVLYNEQLYLGILLLAADSYNALKNSKKAKLVANKFLSLLINILESHHNNQKSLVFYNTYSGIVEELFKEKIIDDEIIARYKIVESNLVRVSNE